MYLNKFEEENFDILLGSGSGAGVIFGTSGGVMEAALRTAYFLLNKKKAPLKFLNFQSVRGKENFREAEVDLGLIKIKVAVLYGLDTVQKMYSTLSCYHFIEVMTCPNGCIGGGGQTVLPKQKQGMYIDARSKSLYEEDKVKIKKCSYENEEIREMYENYLTFPLSKKAEEILHTTYEDKSKVLKATE